MYRARAAESSYRNPLGMKRIEVLSDLRYPMGETPAQRLNAMEKVASDRSPTRLAIVLNAAGLIEEQTGGDVHAPRGQVGKSLPPEQSAEALREDGSRAGGRGPAGTMRPTPLLLQQ
jgi:hypothetical protein